MKLNVRKFVLVLLLCTGLTLQFTSSLKIGTWSEVFAIEDDHDWGNWDDSWDINDWYDWADNYSGSHDVNAWDSADDFFQNADSDLIDDAYDAWDSLDEFYSSSGNFNDNYDIYGGLLWEVECVADRLEPKDTEDREPDNSEDFDPCDNGGCDDNSDSNNQQEEKEEEKEDCAGVSGGSAYKDKCGNCVGGNTGEEACDPCENTAVCQQCGGKQEEAPASIPLNINFGNSMLNWLPSSNGNLPISGLSPLGPSFGSSVNPWVNPLPNNSTISLVSITNNNSSSCDLENCACVKEEEKKKDPCDHLNSFRNDEDFVSRLKDYYWQSTADRLEDGYIKTASGQFFYPDERHESRLKYNFFPTEKLTERVHYHPMGGGSNSGIPSRGDINALHQMYSLGLMDNPTEFLYAVIGYDCMIVLQISDPDAFGEFGEYFGLGGSNLKMFRTEYEAYIKKENLEFNENIDELTRFLNDYNSGLTVHFGNTSEMNPRDRENSSLSWQTKQVGDDKVITNNNCE